LNNTPAMAIAWLLEAGAERVAYVDVDVHHGDGVQAAFYDDPRVLTISLHEDPDTLFPGTGLASEIRSGQGRVWRRRSVRARAAAMRSTWRCPRSPATRPGCGRSTRWCRRCCGRSSPR